MSTALGGWLAGAASDHYGRVRLLLVAWVRKEHEGYVPANAAAMVDFKVNYLKAVVPLIPLIILILGSKGYVPAFRQLAISHAMIIGVFIAFLVTWVSPGQISKVFWQGAGDAFGPFLLAVVCGSGDAAAVAFNKAVTIHAAGFGLNPLSMGSVVVIGGALGRTMSPIAGGAIICCAFAGINPIELATRNALGMCLACVATLGIMLM